MFFEDPIGTVSLELPAGWTCNPFDSTLTDFYFTRWDQPGSLIGVHIRPASIPHEQPDEQWVEKIRSEVGAQASLEEKRIENSFALVADFLPSKGHAQRVVFIRGLRVELVIEQRVTGGRSQRSWAPLDKAVQKVVSTANFRMPEKRGPNEFNQLIEAANAAYEKNEIPAVVDSLQQAVQIGTSAWLQSLAPPVSSPSLHAAVRVAQAMLHLANITGNLSMHRGAESVLRRARCTLENLGPASNTQQLMTEISETLRQMDADILEDTEEKDAVSQILAMRERSFRLSHAASQAFESSDLENAYTLAGMAIEDLLSVLAYLRRNEPQEISEEIATQLEAQGITDPAAQREMLQRAREAILFPPLNLALRILYCCALERTDGSGLEVTEILIVLSELLYQTNPSSAGIHLAHVLALMDRAGALALQAEDKIPDEAEQCLRRAGQVLESIKEPQSGEDGWIRYYDRQIDGTLQAVGQRANAVDSEFKTELLRFRSHFEVAAGRFRDLVQKPS